VAPEVFLVLEGKVSDGRRRYFISECKSSKFWKAWCNSGSAAVGGSLRATANSAGSWSMIFSRGTSRGVVAVGVVAFVVDAFIDVAVIFDVGGVTAIGVVVVVVVACVVVAVGFRKCNITIVSIAIVVSMGTWGGGARLGKEKNQFLVQGVQFG